MEWMFVLTYLGVLFWGGFWGALVAYLVIRAEKKKKGRMKNDFQLPEAAKR
jgi:hypothetical protein